LAPAGFVEAAAGRFTLKIVVDDKGEVPMNKALAGAIVTVFAGSISLSTEHGRAEAQPGQSAVLAAAEAPLFLVAPQDKQEDLLKRLEQLAARVAKLEDEVTRLEAKNKQLKAQMTGNPAPGSVWTVNGQAGGSGGLRVQSAPGQAPGSAVIIELNESLEDSTKKVEPRKTETPKVERKEK
jgi:hypothetical protein